MTEAKDVVVITGASAGIGAALARRLGAEGKRLVLAARRRPELEQVAGEARERGAKGVLVVETDVTRRAEVLRLRDAALEGFAGFDVWINNAGRGIACPVLELRDEDVDEMIASNLKSALYGMQAALPHFVARPAGAPAGAGAPQMPAQTAEEIAEAIAALLDHPVPELYPNPASADLARRYFSDVAAFEERMGQR
jgi:NADP-dependent 3-hydroxy acid dehydrogenase YdfG